MIPEGMEASWNEIHSSDILQNNEDEMYLSMCLFMFAVPCPLPEGIGSE